jgi:hypothetical protein
MSDLNPDRPNHQPIPDHQHIDGKDAIVSITVVAAAAWSCPIFEEREKHGPHQEQAQILLPQLDVITSSGSTSADAPLVFKRATRNVPGFFIGMTSRR